MIVNERSMKNISASGQGKRVVGAFTAGQASQIHLSIMSELQFNSLQSDTKFSLNQHISNHRALKIKVLCRFRSTGEETPLR